MNRIPHLKISLLNRNRKLNLVLKIKIDKSMVYSMILNIKGVIMWFELKIKLQINEFWWGY